MITPIVAGMLLGKAPIVRIEQRPVKKSDFIIGVAVNPGQYIVGLEEDLTAIKKIANTIYASSGRYGIFRTMHLEPLLEAANRHGLKVVLNYYALEDGNTTLEQTVKDYGNHPAVIGFKVQDELGKAGRSADYYSDYLKKVRAIVRKHTDKPIMVDIIPWQLWTQAPSYHKNYPGSMTSAIDRYVNEGSIDWLIFSFGQRIPSHLPIAMNRWGKKVKILVRTSAGFKGSTYAESGMKMAEVKDIADRAKITYQNGGIGIYYYTWKHSTYQIWDKGGHNNPAYDEMMANKNWFDR